MNSSFIITLKCLALSAIIAGGCMIAETIDFNMDFSGTKTIEFSYQSGEDRSNNFFSESGNSFQLSDIDSVFHWIDNVSNLKIDTSDLEIAKVSFDFEADGPKINDKIRYNYFSSKLPEEVRWYFEERPNTFEPINKDQLLWRATDMDILKMGLKEHLEKAEHLKSVETITTLNFPRKIKTVSSDRLIISPDRRTIKAKIDLSEIAKMERENQVLITFEPS